MVPLMARRTIVFIVVERRAKGKRGKKARAGIRRAVDDWSYRCVAAISSAAFLGGIPGSAGAVSRAEVQARTTRQRGSAEGMVRALASLLPE
jgi:hypothetical protein